MSLGSNYRTMINRGRKAGLNTRELYLAMAASPVDGSETTLGQSDCNGFVVSVDAQGRRVYRPLGNNGRP